MNTWLSIIVVAAISNWAVKESPPDAVLLEIPYGYSPGFEFAFRCGRFGIGLNIGRTSTNSDLPSNSSLSLRCDNMEVPVYATRVTHIGPFSNIETPIKNMIQLLGNERNCAFNVNSVSYKLPPVDDQNVLRSFETACWRSGWDFR